MPHMMTKMFMMIRKTAKYFTAILLFMCMPTTASAGMIRDTELETGLQTLMEPLVEAAGYPPNSIAIRIIIDPNYNAFVAGEQIIYVHSGLLLNTKSAEEIIGVLAHEIGHLKAGHVPRRDAAIADANSANALAALAAIVAAAGGSGDAAAGVLIGGQDQATRRLLQTIRYDEAVADEIGQFHQQQPRHSEWFARASLWLDLVRQSTHPPPHLRCHPPPPQSPPMPRVHWLNWHQQSPHHGAAHARPLDGLFHAPTLQ